MLSLTFEPDLVEPGSCSSNGSVVQFLMSWQGGVYFSKQGQGLRLTFEPGQVEPQACSSNGSVAQFLMSW